MHVWIDAGNTRLKWQVFQDGGLYTEGSYVHGGDVENAACYLYESLNSRFNVLQEARFIAMASVWNKKANDRFAMDIKKYFDLDLQFAQVSRVLAGVECAYDNVSKLGVDRWLALVAAFQYYQSPVCVVDCGSALTIDMVNSAGKHLGGYILPGMNMAMTALLGQTHSVRFASDVFQGELVAGRHTAGAVQNGSLLLLVGAVKEAWSRFCEPLLIDEAVNNRVRLVITGGDAGLLAKNLDMPFEQIDDLVLRGLRLAFNRM